MARRRTGRGPVRPHPAAARGISSAVPSRSLCWGRPGRTTVRIVFEVRGTGHRLAGRSGTVRGVPGCAGLLGQRLRPVRRERSSCWWAAASALPPMRALRPSTARGPLPGRHSGLPHRPAMASSWLDELAGSGCAQVAVTTDDGSYGRTRLGGSAVVQQAAARRIPTLQPCWPAAPSPC